MKHEIDRTNEDADTQPAREATNKRLPRIMENIATLLLIVATIVGAIGFLYETFGHKYVFLWVSYFSVCIYLSAFFCYVHAWQLKKDGQAPPSPIPATLATPATKISQITPSDIFNEIERALPFQQDAVARGFVGAPVRWQLPLYTIYRDMSQTKVAFKASTEKYEANAVVVAISEDEAPFLRTARKGDMFIVEGTIKRMTLFIVLDNATVTPV